MLLAGDRRRVACGVINRFMPWIAIALSNTMLTLVTIQTFIWLSSEINMSRAYSLGSRVSRRGNAPMAIGTQFRYV